MPELKLHQRTLGMPTHGKSALIPDRLANLQSEIASVSNGRCLIVLSDHAGGSREAISMVSK